VPPGAPASLGSATVDREKKTVRTRLLLLVLCTLAACAPRPVGLGTLLLSNLDFPPTNVETVITSNPDCGSRGPGYVSTGEFVLPGNATRFLAVPPGSDLCWRRDRDPAHPVDGAWSGWNRAFVAPEATIDASL
jgi:hypothetical protein